MLFWPDLEFSLSLSELQAVLKFTISFSTIYHLNLIGLVVVDNVLDCQSSGGRLILPFLRPLV